MPDILEQIKAIINGGEPAPTEPVGDAPTTQVTEPAPTSTVTEPAPTTEPVRQDNPQPDPRVAQLEAQLAQAQQQVALLEQRPGPGPANAPEPEAPPFPKLNDEAGLVKRLEYEMADGSGLPSNFTWTNPEKWSM